MVRSLMISYQSLTGMSVFNHFHQILLLLCVEFLQTEIIDNEHGFGNHSVDSDDLQLFEVEI